MPLQDTKGRKFIETKKGYNIYDVVVRKDSREDVITIEVPAGPKEASAENENFWHTFERQYLGDATNKHRQVNMVSEEEKQAKLASKVQELLNAGVSKKEILKLLEK